MKLYLILLVSFLAFIGIIAPLKIGGQGERPAQVKKSWSNQQLSDHGTLVISEDSFVLSGLSYAYHDADDKEDRPWIRFVFTFNLDRQIFRVPGFSFKNENAQDLRICIKNVSTDIDSIKEYERRLIKDLRLTLFEKIEIGRFLRSERCFEFKLLRPVEWRANYEIYNHVTIFYIDFREKFPSSKSGEPPKTPESTKPKPSNAAPKNARNDTGGLAALLDKLPGNANLIAEAFKYFKTPAARMPEKFDEVITGVTILNKRDRCFGYEFMFRFLTEVLIPQRAALLSDKNAAKTINNKIDGFSPELSHDEIFFFDLCKRLALQKSPAAKATASDWKTPPPKLSNDLDVEYFSESPDSGKWEHFIYRKILVERPGQWMKNQSVALEKRQIGEIFRSWPARELKIVLLSKLKNEDIGKNYIRRTYGKLLLEVTGAYTSENECIVGLAFQQGKQVGFLPREWEGVLIVDAAGKPQITSLADLRDGDLGNNPGKGMPLSIFHNADDFMKFIKLAGVNKLSLLQSHLLVHRGKYDDKLNRSAGAKRRVLAQFKDGTFAVVNFFHDDLSLHKCARILAEIGVQEAINLDSGSYDVCRIYSLNNEPYVDRSYKNIEARENLISNKLILHY